MKWYDYFACIGCADIIAGGLIHGNAWTLGYGVFMYLFWENLRKWEKSNTQ